jgi:hypothetical protein
MMLSLDRRSRAPLLAAHVTDVRGVYSPVMWRHAARQQPQRELRRARSQRGLAADVSQEKCRALSISSDLVRRADRSHHTYYKEARMRFMVLVPGSPESEAGEMPSTEILGEMTKYNEELARAGVMLAGEGLHPTSRGAKVRFDGSERTVIDGPFTEAKELVAGYWVWQCSSREEAIEWLKRAPFDGGVEIELRQIFEADEFGEQLTPELREANERLREQTAQN